MKAANAHNWVKWIIDNNLPFSFVEYKDTKEFATLDPISVDTLMEHLQNLVDQVRKKVATLLPGKFGLVVDGWIHRILRLVLLSCKEDRSTG